MKPAAPLKFVSSNRRVREDRRFVAGQGRFVADIALEGLLHVALVPSQHPAAKIISIDATEALKMPGVHYALTGDELGARLPLPAYPPARLVSMELLSDSVAPPLWLVGLVSLRTPTSQ